MVMVRFGSVVAEKWQRENWKLAAMVGGSFGNGAKHSPQSAHHTKCSEPPWRLTESIDFSDFC